MCRGMCTQRIHGSRILLLCRMLLPGSKMCRACGLRASVTPQPTSIPTAFAMPTPACCYCGSNIPITRRRREASPQQLVNGAAYRARAGFTARADAKHICGGCNSHPPALPTEQQVRQTSYQTVDASQVPASSSLRSPAGHSWYDVCLTTHHRC
jgi:hypothetical protein